MSKKALYKRLNLIILRLGNKGAQVRGHPHDDPMWIPYSLMKDPSVCNPEAKMCTLEVKEWFVKKQRIREFAPF